MVVVIMTKLKVKRKVNFWLFGKIWLKRIIVKQNIQRSLATQIQEAAAMLRRQQKGLLDKLQDLNSTGSTDLDTAEPNEVEIFIEKIEGLLYNSFRKICRI